MVLTQTKEELVLRGFDYCIVDEVDSILIDEARTPLIISGQSDKPSNKYEMTQKLASALERDYHYTVDEKQKNVLLTEDGYEAAEQVLQVCMLRHHQNNRCRDSSRAPSQYVSAPVKYWLFTSSPDARTCCLLLLYFFDQ